MKVRNLRAVTGLCSLILGCFISTSSAQTVKLDTKRGLELSKRLCVNCHYINYKRQPVANETAPSFRKIANTPGQTEERVAGKLIIPHPDMPTIPLTRSEIRDIIAYIMSLKDKKE